MCTLEFEILLPRGMSGRGGELRYYPGNVREYRALLARLAEIGIYYIDLSR